MMNFFLVPPTSEDITDFPSQEGHFCSFTHGAVFLQVYFVQLTSCWLVGPSQDIGCRNVSYQGDFWDHNDDVV